MNTENTEKFISLSEASKQTGYNQDYLGYLCRNGKLKGFKIGRNWVTTQSGIDQFLNSLNIENQSTQSATEKQVQINSLSPKPEDYKNALPKLSHLKQEVLLGLEDKIAKLSNKVFEVEKSVGEATRVSSESGGIVLNKTEVISSVQSSLPTSETQILGFREKFSPSVSLDLAPNISQKEQEKKADSKALNFAVLYESFKNKRSSISNYLSWLLGGAFSAALAGLVILLLNFSQNPKIHETQIVYQNSNGILQNKSEPNVFEKPSTTNSTIIVNSITNNNQVSKLLGMDKTTLYSMIDEKLNQYLAEGKFKGAVGETGAQGQQGVPGIQGLAGSSSAGLQGGWSVGYTAPSSSSGGTGSIGAITHFSSQTFSTEDLNVSDTATINSLTVTNLNTGLTAGSVVFQGSGALAQDNSNFYWDDSNNILSLGTTTIATSSILQLESTDKGFLAPRMTTAQRDAIAGPATGLLVYNLTTSAYNFYNGSSWSAVGTGSGGGSLTGGVKGYVATWASSTELTVGTLIDNGTVAGLNATSSSITLNVQSSPGLDGLNVSSSSGTSYLRVTSLGNVGIGSSSPSSVLTVNGGIYQYPGAGKITQISTTTLGSTPSAFTISGRYAYVVNQNSDSLSVVDISNPYAPVQIATTSIGSSPRYAVVAHGNYVYLTNNNGATVSIIDVSNPYAPTQISSFSVSSAARGLAVSGHYLYVASFSLGRFYVYDISNPHSPSRVGELNMTQPFFMTVSGRYAYVTNFSLGTLSIVDVSNPSAPVLAGTATVGGSPRGVVVSGSYAFVGNSASSTVSVIDISNPSSPAEVATVSVTGADQLFVAGRNLYVGGTNGVSVFDIANPENPTLVDTVLNGNSNYPYVSGRYLYADGSYFVAADLGGVDAANLAAGSAEVGTLQALSNVTVQGALTANTSLFVGQGGILSRGPIAVSATNTPSYFGGQLLIGTTSTSSMLTLQSKAGVNPFSISSSTGAQLLTFTQAGNLGIGTATPLHNLDVVGTVRISSGDIYAPDNSGVRVRMSNSGVNTFGQFQVSNLNSSPLFTVLNSGLVGIGSSSPVATLSVVGTSTLPTTDILRVASSSGSSYLAVVASGLTTINQLTVNGTTTLSAATTTINGVTYYWPSSLPISNRVLQSDASGNLTWVTDQTGGGGSVSGGLIGYVTSWASSTGLTYGTLIDNGTVAGQNATSSTISFNIQGTAGSIDPFNVSSSSGTSFLRVTQGGNVGIGSSTPTAKLTVVGTSGSTSDIFKIASSSGASYIQVTSLGNVTVATLTASSLIMSDANKNLQSVILGSGLSISGSTLNTTQAGGAWTIGSGLIYNATSTDLVGIGTSSPTALLHLETTSSTLPLLKVATSTNQGIFNITQAGSVGIGTTTPRAKLAVVQGEGAIASVSSLAYFQNNASTVDWSVISILAGNAGTSGIDFSDTNDINAGGIYYNHSTDVMHIRIGDTANRVVFGSGRVGINSSTPAATLGITSVAGVDPFLVSSSTGTSLFSINTFGSTTIANLSSALPVRSTSGGSLFNGAIALGGSDVTGVLGVSNGGTGSSTLGTTLVGFVVNDTNVTGSIANNTLTLGFTGSLAVARGGTGTTTIGSAGSIPYSDGSTFRFNQAGSAGNFLMSNGTGQPAWTSTSTLFGGTPITSTGSTGLVARWTGASTLGTGLLIDNGTVAGINATSSTITFNLQGSAGSNDIFNVSSSTGISVLRVTNNQRVGIGSTTPNATLVVQGTSTSPTLDILRVASSSNTTLLVVTSAGYVGIGTTTPTAMLTIANDLYVVATNSTTTLAGGLNVNNGSILHDWSSGQTSIDNLALGSMSFDDDAGTVNWVDMAVTASSSASTINSYTAQIDGIALLTVYAESAGNGNIQNPAVGIGTTTPIASLALQGSASSTEALVDFASSTGTSLLRVTQGGSVGISSSSPTAKLTVVGTSGSTANVLTVASSTNSALFTVASNGSTTIANLSSALPVRSTSAGSLFNGAIALGSSDVSGVLAIANGGTATTSSPTVAGQLLSAHGSGSWGVTNLVAGSNITITTSTPGEITIAASAGGSGSISTSTHAQLGKVAIWTGLATLGNGSLLDNGTVAGINATSSTISFNLQGSGTLDPFNVSSSSTASLLVVKESGKVGINTTTPLGLLTVAGTAGSTVAPLIIASSSGHTLLSVSSNGAVTVGGTAAGQTGSISVRGNESSNGVGVTITNSSTGNLNAGAARVSLYESTADSNMYMGLGYYNGGDGAAGRFNIGNTNIGSYFVINPSNSGTGIGQNNDAPFGTLLVKNGGGSAVTTMYIQAGSGQGSSNLFSLQSNAAAGSAGNTYTVFNSTGFLGVGTSTPASQIQVVGDIQLGSKGSTTSSSLVFNTGSTTNQTTIRLLATTSLASSYTLTLPTTTPTAGQVLGSTVNGELYWATAGGSLTGSGTTGFSAIWNGSTALTTGKVIDNGTVAGINATSSTISFNLQGSGVLDPFNISSSSGTSILNVKSNLRVGIASSTPNAMFVVQGTNEAANTTTPIFVVASSTGQQLMTVLANGNVGIGTSNPGFNMHLVAGNPVFRIQNGSAISDFSDLLIELSSAGTSLVVNGGNFDIQTNTAAGATVGGTQRFLITNAGNVGIGTSSPTGKLTVTSSGTTTPLIISSSSGVTLLAVDYLGNLNLATLTASSLVMSDANKNLQSVTLGSGLSISGSTLNTSANSAWTLGSGLIYNATSTDLVGIGTITPTTTLFVQGKGGTNPFAIASSTGTQLLTVTQAGNVGIGTSTPTGEMHIVASKPSGSVSLLVQNLSATNPRAVLQLKTANRTWNIANAGNGSNEIAFTDESSNSSLKLSVSGHLTAGYNALTQTSNILGVYGNAAVGANYYNVAAPTNGLIVQGQTGIGTSSPIATLSVMGTSTLPTTTLFTVASSSGEQYLTVAPNGSTTLSSLASAGCVGTTASGGLYVTTCGGGSLSGTGTNGQVAYYTGASTLTSAAALLNNGTVVGINASSSTISLNVQGSGTLDPFNVSSSSTTSLLVVKQSGNVGIGTTTPTAKLNLTASGYATNPFLISSSSGTSLLFVSPYGGLVQNISSSTALSIQDGSGNQVFTVDTATTTGAGIDITGAAGQTGALFTISSSSGTSYLYVTALGNVGISSSTPTAKLTVVGTSGSTANVFVVASSANSSLFTIGPNGSTTISSLSNALPVRSTAAGSLFNGAIALGSSDVSGVLSIANGGTATTSSPTLAGQLLAAHGSGSWGVTNLVAGSNITITTSTPGSITIAATGGSGNSAFTIGSGLIYNATSTDLVGIGTITPTTTLFVQGKGDTNPFAIASSTGTQLLTVNQRGSVGIGTSTSLHPFVITSTSGATLLSVATSGVVTISRADDTSGGGLLITPRAGGSGPIIAATGCTSLTIGALSFGCSGPVTASNSILFPGNSTWNSSGNVGIGTSTPSSRLQVVGDIQLGSKGSTTASSLVFNTGSTTNQTTVRLLATTSLASSYTLTLPTTTPMAGQVLGSTVNGELFWNTVAPSNANAAFTIGSGLIYNATSTDLVGIGTITPTTTLFVQGKGGTNPFAIASSTGTQLLTVTQAGNVGIGTTTPIEMLHIQAGNILLSNQYSLRSLTTTGANAALIQIDASDYNSLYSPLSNTGIKFKNAVSGDLMTILNGGNIGIGTSTPAAKLVIQNAAGTTDVMRIASSSGASMIYVSAFGGFVQNISSSTAVHIMDGSTTPASVFVVDTTNASGNAGLDITAGGAQTGNLLNFFSSGGIAMLSVTAPGGFVQNVSSTTAFQLQNGAGSLVFNIDTVGKKIGLGTSTGLSSFDIISDISIDEVGSPSTGSGTATGLRVITSDDDSPSVLIRNSSPVPCIGQATGCSSAVAAGSAGMLTLESSTSSNTSWYNFITAFSGTTRSAGNAVFRVRGDGNVYGEAAFNASGADYAEYFDTFDTALEPGDIVIATTTDSKLMLAALTDAGLSSSSTSTIISALATSTLSSTSSVNSLGSDSQLVSAVMKSQKAYDSKILGIVSSQAAFIGNNPGGRSENNKFKKPVGLVGRVPVKVTNENGEIKVGDFITTSGQFNGYGMKASRSGYVLGQALEEFKPSATSTSSSGPVGGTVLVFINPGYQTVNNTFVLGENDGQIANATGTPGVVASNSFIIDQKGSGNILQLQKNGMDKFVVQNSGAAVLYGESGNSSAVLSVITASSTMFSINSKGDLTAKGKITVGKDTAGTAIISSGDNKVTVTFNEAYASVPKVIVTVQGLPNFFYGVTEKTENGFTITTSQVVGQDFKFDWVALNQPEENGSGESGQNLSVHSSPNNSNNGSGNNQPAPAPDQTPEPTSAPPPIEQPTGGEVAPQSDSGQIAGAITEEANTESAPEPTPTPTPEPTPEPALEPAPVPVETPVVSDATETP